MSVQKLFVSAVGIALVGCAGSTGPARSSGSLAVSNDQQFLYAVDTDSSTLFVLNAKTLDTVSQVKVGAAPFRVVVGADDTVYVANRQSRSISVIHKGDWSVAGQIATGVDPTGMQVTDDGKTLYVVSATAVDTADHGTLQAIDTATLQNKWTMPVGQEPRGLALIAGNQAVISLFKEGDLQVVDLAGQTVVQSSTDIYQQANKSALSSTLTTQAPSPTNPVTFKPRGLVDVAATPDGTRVFVPGQLSRESPILVPPSAVVPYYEAQGPKLAGSVSTPAVFTFDTSAAGLTAKIDDVGAGATSCSYCGATTTPDTSGNDYPQTSFAVSGAGSSPVLQGPSTAVVDMTGAWLFVVNRETSNVSVISTRSHNAKPTDDTSNTNVGGYYAYGYGNELPSVHTTLNVGAGADGVAILGDNQTAYVYSQFDHKVTRITLDARDSTLVTDGEKTITTDVLAPDVAAGRRLFYDANNREVSAVTASVACSSCHLEGRDDGHTWEFNDGPRQTPTLAGRGITHTAPFHWSGEFTDIGAFFTNVVTERMGGTGLTGLEPDQVGAFMDALPAPENPYAGRDLTAAQVHGSQLFQAQCSTCHIGQWLTDNAKHNVGTLNTQVYNPDNGVVMNTGFNTPSLKGLARSAPYLHDGSAATLMDRLNNDGNGVHGNTAALPTQDKSDLIEYLKTL